MKYRKKPVVIEAMQFNSESQNSEEFLKFLDKASFMIGKVSPMEAAHSLQITTLEGIMTANEGDFIIKGVKGEFYPCREDIFYETYEEVEE